MEKLFIVKIGGNIIDDEEKLSAFLMSFSELEGKKILVHGGGKLATRVAEALGTPQKMIDGRRVTDPETLKVITMVYAGYINKNIVAKLQALKTDSIGICGVDGNLISAHKRIVKDHDYGFVGHIDSVNFQFLNDLLSKDFTIVIAPVTHNSEGILLNTNADTVANEIAKSCTGIFDVSLVYCFEKSGVMTDADDESTVISELTRRVYEEMKASGKVFAGMIPKLDNAFNALESGIKNIYIGKAENFSALINLKSGTRISFE